MSMCKFSFLSFFRFIIYLFVLFATGCREKCYHCLIHEFSHMCARMYVYKQMLHTHVYVFRV